MSRIDDVRTIAMALPYRLRRAADARSRPCFSRAALVTLDVFDTALLRSVAQPDDVFSLIALRVRTRTGQDLDIDAFKRARRSAEHRSREIARLAGRYEVTLREIYAGFGDAYEPALLEALRHEEVAAEADVCFANPDILSLHQALQAVGTRVAFVSDTYLDTDTVTSMLAARGYSGTLEVHVSSAYGIAKGEGGLFGELARILALEPASIWHIGDNPWADVVQARRFGWNGLWYRPRLRRSRPVVDRSLPAEQRIMRSLLQGVPASLGASTTWGAIGQQVAGPVYLGFAQWLHQQMAVFQPDRLLFCARDGRIVKAAYDRLPPLVEAPPPTTYFMVSRRSIVLPAIERIGPEELQFLAGNFTSLPVHEFLSRIGLSPEHCASVVAAHGLDLLTTIDNDEKQAALRAVLMELEPEILAVAHRERVLFERYLAQEGALAGRLAIIDIGWHGSLQKAFVEILQRMGRSADVGGFYFGTNPRVTTTPVLANATLGWFVNAGEPFERFHITKSQWAILELLFTAPHGSVLGYEQAADGHIEAILQPQGSTVTAGYSSAAGRIQEAALAFIDRYIAAFGGLPPIPIDIPSVLPSLQRLLFSPTPREATDIGDLFQVDGFGATERGQHIAKAPSLLDLLTAPKRHLSGYQQAPWRRGYLVRLFGSTAVAGYAIAAVKLVRPSFRSE